MLVELEQRGVLLIEADTDGVLFGVPSTWTEADERQLIDEVGKVFPDGISVEHDGRYAAMYSYAEKNYALQSYDGKVRLVGGSFRSSRSERYGEQFLRAAVPLLLEGRFEALRDLYLETVARLRNHEIPIEDLCISVILSKNPETYARSGRREEQYEVLIGAGRDRWKGGDRVSYYQARGGRKKLASEHAGDEDPEYYVRRLKEIYCQRLARALTREDFELLFGENLSLWETSLADIKPLTTRERTPTRTDPWPLSRKQEKGVPAKSIGMLYEDARFEHFKCGFDPVKASRPQRLDGCDAPQVAGGGVQPLAGTVKIREVLGQVIPQPQQRD